MFLYVHRLTCIKMEQHEGQIECKYQNYIDKQSNNVNTALLIELYNI